MPTTPANGITIEYDTFGDASAPPVLMIMGLGAQMVVWESEFCQAIADEGYYVIRFDNRDVGLSTWFDHIDAPSFGGIVDGSEKAPYSLSDMAADAVGLLDALGIDSAHIVGASMGGMIAQVVAIEYPQRTLTLTSIMSTTGDRSVGQSTPEAIAVLLTPTPSDREGYLDARIGASRVIGSPGYPSDETRLRARAAEMYDRAYHPPGMARQLAAVMSSPDRTPMLEAVTVPTLVIHGADDPLVHASGGEATAKAVPGADLKIIDGMGHDLPPQLNSEVVSALAQLFSRV